MSSKSSSPVDPIKGGSTGGGDAFDPVSGMSDTVEGVERDWDWEAGTRPIPRPRPRPAFGCTMAKSSSETQETFGVTIVEAHDLPGIKSIFKKDRRLLVSVTDGVKTKKTAANRNWEGSVQWNETFDGFSMNESSHLTLRVLAKRKMCNDVVVGMLKISFESLRASSKHGAHTSNWSSSMVTLFEQVWDSRTRAQWQC
ncbi:hypothetical protein B0H14DRAFT_3489186 [Mycena olivaceomarginata]|nr:hypothetical protein B0H14DRAFT_3489186 [Mycena olivaceomarginata]